MRPFVIRGLPTYLVQELNVGTVPKCFWNVIDHYCCCFLFSVMDYMVNSNVLDDDNHISFRILEVYDTSKTRGRFCHASIGEGGFF